VSDPIRALEDANALVEEADHMQGLGDAVAKVTHALGFHECSECEKRRRRLNEMVPFARKRRRQL
jgi:hypothetical protein